MLARLVLEIECHPPLGLVLEARERHRYLHPEVSEGTVSNGFNWRETPQCTLADDALIFMKCSLGWNRVATSTFVLRRVFQPFSGPPAKARFSCRAQYFMKEFSYAYRADCASL